MTHTNKELLRIALMVQDKTDLNLWRNTRIREYVYARCVFYMLARDLTPFPVTEIGSVFNKNHATVLHGIKVFRDVLWPDKDTYWRDLYLDCVDDLQATEGLKLSRAIERVWDKVNNLEVVYDAVL